MTREADRKNVKGKHDAKALFGKEGLSEQGGKRFEFQPVTTDRLEDLERFSLAHGTFRYCSCMRWRMRSTEYKDSTKESRSAALAALVSNSTPIGVLAYADGEPIGWCSIAPRETYDGLERFRALPRLDDEPVWSVVCFFVDSRFRHRGLTLGLLDAAMKYARSMGAKIVEGYPVRIGEKLYQYMGATSTFEEAGFSDVTPVQLTRKIFRARGE